MKKSPNHQNNKSNGTFFFNFRKLLRTLLIVIPIGVIGNIIFSFMTTDRYIFTTLVHFSFPFFILAIILTIIPWFTHALRLLVWTRFLNHHHIKFGEMFKIVIAGELAASVTPTAVGGAPVKLGMLIQKGIKPGMATSLTTLSTVEDGIFFAIAIPLGLTISSTWGLPFFGKILTQLKNPFVLSILITISSLITLLILFNQPLRKILRNWEWELFQKVKRKIKIIWLDFREVYLLIGQTGKSRFAFNMLFTAIQWMARYSVICALVLSLGIPLDAVGWVRLFVLQWVVFSLGTLVPTPGAVGGIEAAFYLIYRAFLPNEIIGFVIAGWRFLTFYLLLILDIFIFFGLSHKYPD